jgi:DNA invertase Pin-like site-specific DNA recombinase
MQRQRIQENLLTPSQLPFHKEYKDLLSGTTSNRADYQQMLTDAKLGRFSHLGMYRADRFGRNTLEGLHAATLLIELGVKVRVASSPSLRPEEPDGLFMFQLQMGMAQREVDVLVQRTRDGIEAKFRNGGWPNMAPEGYVNKERQISSNKYERWVEADPEYVKQLREAWDLLLTSRYTLSQICEQLNRKGYIRSNGRPWVWDDPKTGKRMTARNRLHAIFHKPFYAGWVVSERFGIKMGEVRGKWEPIVTTDEFERGKAILLDHGNNKSNFKKKHYLLRNVLWVQVEKKQYKMYGSTPSGRSQSYSYYITHAKPQGKAIRLRTNVVDEQVADWLDGININPDQVSGIREIYQNQIKKTTQDDKDVTITELNRKLAALKREETRLGRLFMTGKINEDAYDQLRTEWHEKTLSLQIKIEEIKFDVSQYLDDLEVALTLMMYISSLYERLDEKQKTNLLQIITNKVIINCSGEIISHELNSPFEYLFTLAASLNGETKEGGGSDHVRDRLLLSEKPFTDDVERFFDMLRFPSREKLKDLPID